MCPYRPSPNSSMQHKWISENMIIAQEVIHNFKKIKRKKGFLGLKLDFQKAYDEMEWKFLVVVPKTFGFSDKFV